MNIRFSRIKKCKHERIPLFFLSKKKAFYFFAKPAGCTLYALNFFRLCKRASGFQAGIYIISKVRVCHFSTFINYMYIEQKDLTIKFSLPRWTVACNVSNIWVVHCMCSIFFSYEYSLIYKSLKESFNFF